MRRLKAIANPYRGNHQLAAELWETGSYEARTIAVFVDDPGAVDVDQMNRWCRQFDNWAIVDTTCFNLFDKAAEAWQMIDSWVGDDAEFVKRAGFALLWALALHDNSAPDKWFVRALGNVAPNATDPRPFVGKAITMAMRAIATKRSALAPTVLSLAQELSQHTSREARRVARPIIKMLA